MRKIIFTLFFLSITLASKAQKMDSFFNKADMFFKSYVSDNKVDYVKIKKNTDKLEEILELISKIDLSNENTSTIKAFWINAYNIYVIKGIVNKYPVKSPLDISGFFDKIVNPIANKKLTLNDIENKILRAKFSDARMHFALVCGANGCPPIINKAYFPNTLDDQLNKQTKIAINNSSFIKVNENAKKVQVSQIFEWYKEDFVTKNSTEIDFINKFRTDKIDEKSKLSYYNYDWSLNKSK